MRSAEQRCPEWALRSRPMVSSPPDCRPRSWPPLLPRRSGAVGARDTSAWCRPTSWWCAPGRGWRRGLLLRSQGVRRRSKRSYLLRWQEWSCQSLEGNRKQVLFCWCIFNEFIPIKKTSCHSKLLWFYVICGKQIYIFSSHNEAYKLTKNNLYLIYAFGHSIGVL